MSDELDIPIGLVMVNMITKKSAVNAVSVSMAGRRQGYFLSLEKRTVGLQGRIGNQYLLVYTDDTFSISKCELLSEDLVNRLEITKTISPDCFNINIPE